MIKTARGHIAALAVSILTVVFWCAPALANMGAPKTIRSPSGALAPAEPGSLEVLGEELSFTCAENCLIEAVYRIQAHRGGDFDLNFILPEPHPVSVEVNGLARQALTQPFNWEMPERRSDHLRYKPGIDMARASFTARLKPGLNTIRIRYQQDWGLDQRRFKGYFSGWDSIQEVSYELWPLKEWRMALGFRLKIRVYVTEKLATKKRVVLRAFELTEGPGRDVFVAPRPQGYRPVSFELEMGLKFPDRIRLAVGSAKILGLEGEASGPIPGGRDSGR